MRTILFFIMILSLNGYALRKAPDRPQARELLFDPLQPNHFYVIADVPENFDAKGARRIAYETTEGGWKFNETPLSAIPRNCTSNNPFSEIQYIMVHEGNPEMPFTGHQLILRSRDRGKTWHLTYYERHINLLTDDALQYHIDSRVSEGKLPIKFGYFTCVYYLKILSGIYGIIMVLFLWRAGLGRMLVSLAKSGLLILVFNFVISYIYNCYDYLILCYSGLYGIILHALIYTAVHPLSLVLGFIVLAAVLPSTIDGFRYKGGKWNPRDNWLFVLWDSLGIIFWILIGYAVLWCHMIVVC